MSNGLFKHADKTAVFDGGNLFSVNPGSGTPADYARDYTPGSSSSTNTTAVAGLTWNLLSGTWLTRFPGPKQYTTQSPTTYCVVLPDVTTLNDHGGDPANAGSAIADAMYAQRNDTGCDLAVWCSIPVPPSYTGDPLTMAIWLSSYLQACQTSFGLTVLDLFNLVPSDVNYWNGTDLTAVGAQLVGTSIADYLDL